MAWWFAHLPHTSRVGGSIPASTICLHVLPLPCGFPLGILVPYPQSRDISCRLTDTSKLSVIDWHPVQEVSCLLLGLVLR